jgi:hypothetical protein
MMAQLKSQTDVDVLAVEAIERLERLSSAASSAPQPARINPR